MKQEENATITFPKKKLENLLFDLIWFPVFFSLCTGWLLRFTEIVEEYHVYIQILCGVFGVLLLAFYGIFLWFLRKYYSTKKLWRGMVASLCWGILFYIYIVRDIFW
jgi:uncharacterized membrane protein